MTQLVTHLLQPFPLLFLALLFGNAYLWRARKEKPTRLLLSTLPLAGLAALCSPPVGHLALGTLEWQHPPLLETPTDVDAIVVLAGGWTPPHGVFRHAELNPASIYRCLHARECYREVRRPILLSGGKDDPSVPGPTISEAMRDFLVQLGTAPEDLIVEGRSQTTYENALESAKLLRQRGVRKVLLVTDATHMPRAVKVFRKQGLDPVPSGCQYRAIAYEFSPSDLLPSPSAALSCQEAFHEWVGMIWYRFRGRL